jgi:hypothetical protein
MDTALIEQLYAVANDDTAESKDRDDARNYLSEHEAEIVATFLVLPEMPRSKDGGLMFPDYEKLHFRNCLDATHNWNSELGRMQADMSSIPAEADKIGSCLFRWRAARKAQALEAHKYGA